jgi:pyruvate ferredoxin oxidoreductase beta subunit
VGQGKAVRRKDLTSIIAAHNIPYVAQASISDWKDLTAKAEKAFAVEGAAFINVFAPCPRGWRIPYSATVEIAKLAVQTAFWPLFEVVDGDWRYTKRSVTRENRAPVEEFLKPQGRFKHLFRPGNEELLASVQTEVDRNFDYILKRCGS